MMTLAIDLGKFTSVACLFDTATQQHRFETIQTPMSHVELLPGAADQAHSKNGGGTIIYSTGTTGIDRLKLRSGSSLFVTGGILNVSSDVQLAKNTGNLLELNGGTVNVGGDFGITNESGSDPFTVTQIGSVGGLNLTTLDPSTGNDILNLFMDGSTGIAALTLATANTTKNFQTLSVTTNGYTSGSEIHIMDIGGTTDTQFAFASITVDSVAIASTDWAIDYSGGDGNDVVLNFSGSTIPEPTSLSLFALGGLGMMFNRRRRRA